MPHPRTSSNSSQSHGRADKDVDQPFARRVPRAKGKPDQLRPHQAEAEDRQEALIDEAVEESFPASDPVSPKRIT